MTTIHKALEQALGALEATQQRLELKCAKQLVAFNGEDVDALTAAQTALTEGRKALAEQGEQKINLDEAVRNELSVLMQPHADAIDREVFLKASEQAPGTAGEPISERCEHGVRWDSVCRSCDELPASEQASVSGCYEVAGAQSRFKNVAVWTPCTVEHHHMVQRNPEEWEGYETRLVYSPPPLAAAPEVKP